MAITNATNATPIVVTSAAHGFETGNVIQVVGVVGNTAANHVYKITVIDADSFSLDDSVGDGDYDSGGTAYGITANQNTRWGEDVDIGESTTVEGTSAPIDLGGPLTGVWPYGILRDGDRIEYLVTGGETLPPQVMRFTLAGLADWPDPSQIPPFCDACNELNATHDLDYIDSAPLTWRKEASPCNESSNDKFIYLMADGPTANLYFFAAENVDGNFESYVVKYVCSPFDPQGHNTFSFVSDGGSCASGTWPSEIVVSKV